MFLGSFVILLGLPSFSPVWSESNDGDWTSADTEIVTRADRLSQQGQNDAVEATVGDSKSAVTWWQRSAALGSKTGARWLSWAYSVGYPSPLRPAL